MTNLDLSWMDNPDWYEYDKDGYAVVKDSAPEEIKEKYKKYLIKMKAAEKRGAL